MNVQKPIEQAPLQVEPARRSDGEAARERLLHTALRLFAQHGFSKTSTRQIAAEAGANVGAIAYYFGDKQGLYRAVYQEPLGSPCDDISGFAPEQLTLEQALRGLYDNFLAPLKRGEIVRLCMRLHYREMVEPTGLWQEEINTGIAPYQVALAQVLARHLGVDAQHTSVQRLVVSIVAQGVFSFMGQDVFERTMPELFATPDAIDAMAEHFTRCALAMVEAERICLAATTHPNLPVLTHPL